MLRLIEVLLHPGAAYSSATVNATPTVSPKKGVRVALRFILATSASADTLGQQPLPLQTHAIAHADTKLHAAYQKADASLQQIVDLVAV